jgi:hypothetical protein
MFHSKEKNAYSNVCANAQAYTILNFITSEPTKRLWN